MPVLRDKKCRVGLRTVNAGASMCGCCTTEEVSGDSDSIYVYFIRTIPFGKSLNLSTAADAELVFGEVPRLPLQALHTTLSSIFLPAVEQFDNSDWYAA